MKAFLIGALGAIIILIAAALAILAYTDFTQRVITSEIIVSTGQQQKDIEKSILSKTPIQEQLLLNTTKHIQFIKVLNNGVILVKATGKGQMVVLTPTIHENSVNWSCIGSPNIWVPLKCRST